MRILITGGAGFVGAHLARAFQADKITHGTNEIVCFDNLKRRGAEFNLPEFKKQGVQFVHGDIRSPADLDDLSGNFDLFIEASAEPSVLAGLNGSPSYVLQTNLAGTLNCLEFARKRAARMLFLSTSRVYSIQPLQEIQLEVAPTRFEIAEKQAQTGVTSRGISEAFRTDLPRSLYGASKLASEMIIQEYADTYRYPALINRCGVLAGPGQFGKVDQGVFTLWVLHHYFGRPLKYTGFGGAGKQVRDLLHPVDLYTLITKQIQKHEFWNGSRFNVGGGREVSVSMQEMTRICEEKTGRALSIESNPNTAPVDIPLYVSDSTQAEKAFDWKPSRSVPTIVSEIVEWIRGDEQRIASLL